MPSLFRQYLKQAVLTGSLLAGISTACAQSAPGTSIDMPRAGTFKQVQGDVRVSTESRSVAPQPGDPVRTGERVTTGSNGAASLVLRDGTVLTLGPSTSTTLNQYQFDATTQDGNFLLDLLQGSLRVVTGLIGKIHPERFKVKTPTVVVGVRGTDFIVEELPEQKPLYYYLRHHWSDHSRLRR